MLTRPPYVSGIDERFFNRDLSWLAFNERVLSLARETAIPLLERAKFCAIFSSNLDEFFQVRVAGLKHQIDDGVLLHGVDGRSPAQVLAEVSATVRRLVSEQEELLTTGILPALAEHGIRLAAWSDLDEPTRERLTKEFRQRIFPVLTPLVVDPAHPFPYISGLALSIGATVVDPSTDDEKFTRVKVPPLLPRLVEADAAGTFVTVEDVIIAHLGELYEGMDVRDPFVFRVTRDADIEVDDEDADDLREAIEEELRRRRFGRYVYAIGGNPEAAELGGFVCEGSPSLNVEVTAAYWRKANAIHGWFVDNVQNGEDNCSRYYVSRDNMSELVTLCKKVIKTGDASELPPQAGFFFGSTAIGDDYFDDLKNTVKQLTAVLNDKRFESCEFYYQASW